MSGAAMMKLGLFLQGGGHHIAAWRDPTVPSNAPQSLAHYVEIVRMAEHARFDLVFNADTQATFGPDDINVWRRTTGALALYGLSRLLSSARSLRSPSRSVSSRRRRQRTTSRITSRGSLRRSTN